MYKLRTTVDSLWVGKTSLNPGQSNEVPAHVYYYHLVYVVNGQCNFTVNGNPYALSDDMIVIARPGETIAWRNGSEASVDIYEVKFAIRDAELRGAVAKLPSVIVVTLLVKLLMERIALEKDNGIYLAAFLYELKREAHLEPNSDEDLMAGNNLVQSVFDYVEEHYCENDLSLDKIAQMICFNKSYVATVFKEATGITVNEFIFRTRIYKSCELIAYSNRPLEEVSSMMGFKNRSHFTRSFKKYIGIPPREYRDATPKMATDYNKDIGTFFNAECIPVRSSKRFEVESSSGFYRRVEE